MIFFNNFCDFVFQYLKLVVYYEINFLLFHNIFIIADNFFVFVDNKSFLFILKILWLNSVLFFIWSFHLFKTFALSLFFFEMYCIVNLYYSKNSDHFICHWFNFFILMKFSKFLWFVNMIIFDFFFTYIFHFFKMTIMMNNFLSWTS